MNFGKGVTCSFRNYLECTKDKEKNVSSGKCFLLEVKQMRYTWNVLISGIYLLIRALIGADVAEEMGRSLLSDKV